MECLSQSIKRLTCTEHGIVPPKRDDGAPIVIAGVTSCQGERESRSQGEVEQVSQISCKLRETAKCVMLLNILGLFASVAKKV